MNDSETMIFTMKKMNEEMMKEFEYSQNLAAKKEVEDLQSMMKIN